MTARRRSSSTQSRGDGVKRGAVLSLSTTHNIVDKLVLLCRYLPCNAPHASPRSLTRYGIMPAPHHKLPCLPSLAHQVRNAGCRHILNELVHLLILDVGLQEGR